MWRNNVPRIDGGPCIYARCMLIFLLRVRRSQKPLYENLPEQIKMAILSRRPILLAILLYEQFKHLKRINLRPNAQFLSTQQYAYQSFFGYFLV